MWHAITQPTGIVETVLWGVVGREPAREGTVDAFRDCIVPILQKKSTVKLTNPTQHTSSPKLYRSIVYFMREHVKNKIFRTYRLVFY
jgi:hypothetical protein